MARIGSLKDLYTTARKIVDRKSSKTTSPEETIDQVEGLVNIYKHNYEAFIEDYKKTHFATVVSIPFTEEELTTFEALRFAVIFMDDKSVTSVNELHQKLSNILNDYTYPRSRTYRVLERGCKNGLFNKQKVKNRVTYTLTKEVYKTKMQLLEKTIRDYLAATKLMNLGTAKAVELDEDWNLEMLIKSGCETVNLFLLGHY